MGKTVLVTGGTGYIGSHTVVELIKAGHTPVIVDNLVNSKADVIDKIKKITGTAPAFYKVDIRDKKALDGIFKAHKIDSVIHFAGLKAVGESVEKPLEYYDNNVGGTVTLLEAMKENGVKNIIFSSSATVYGDPKQLPINEETPLPPIANCPYGSTKLFIEYILKDIYTSDNEWNVTLLRYFNPVGAHESGLIGENPNGIPNNLTPYIAQVAAGKLDHLRVFGNDYPTPDGTGIRDYIHVVDLSIGHLLALEKISGSGVHIYNLGTGKGSSVLDVLNAFSKAVGRELPYKFYPRRAGDIAACYADPKKAETELGFKAKFGIDEMCASMWKFQQNIK